MCNFLVKLGVLTDSNRVDLPAYKTTYWRSGEKDTGSDAI